MKKFASLFLTAIILIISVFSVNAFAQENNFQFSEVEAVVSNSINNGEKITARIYYKDSKIAMVQDIPYTDFISLPTKIIIKDEEVYMYSPSFPFVHVKFAVEDVMLPEWEDATQPEDMTLVKTEEITDGEIKYTIEEYITVDGINYKYIFENGKLIRIEISGYDENGDYCESSLDLISDKVDDSVFEIPWYSIELSFLIDILSDYVII